MLAAIFTGATTLAWAGYAAAQQSPQGFAVERLYQGAPGSGWVVMDDLDIHGGLGGVAAISFGYAHNPLKLRTRDGQKLTVVSDQAFTDFGFAATYDRFRVYLNFDMPLLIKGDSGTIGGYTFTAPAASPGSNPDTLMDARIGLDARLLGDVSGPFRLGAGAQLIVPNSDRALYDTDGTLRAMFRVLLAGNAGRFAYAGHLGVHVRPLDDSPAPGNPQGSELLFGVAGGPRFAVGKASTTSIVIGPEIYGESALRSFMSTSGTGVEGLVTGRLEGPSIRGAEYRLKVGGGGGLSAHFGAPEWRMVLGLELFSHDARDHAATEGGKDR